MLTAPEKDSIRFYEKRMRILGIVAMVAIACAGLGYALDQKISADLSWLWRVPGSIAGLAAVGAMMCGRNKARLESEDQASSFNAKRPGDPRRNKRR